MKETKIISAFPACGKTYCYEHMDKDMVVFDSDSSLFSWKEVLDEEHEMKNKGKRDYQERYIKVRNPNFPDNYIQHIKDNIGKADYIFVSSHKEVRDAMKKNGIRYTVVYPWYGLKEEWIGRCFLRGSGERFCQLLADNWDEWISDMRHEDDRRELLAKEHLMDIIYSI